MGRAWCSPETPQLTRAACSLSSPCPLAAPTGPFSGRGALTAPGAHRGARSVRGFLRPGASSAGLVVVAISAFPFALLRPLALITAVSRSQSVLVPRLSVAAPPASQLSVTAPSTSSIGMIFVGNADGFAKSLISLKRQLQLHRPDGSKGSGSPAPVTVMVLGGRGGSYGPGRHFSLAPSLGEMRGGCRFFSNYRGVRMPPSLS